MPRSFALLFAILALAVGAASASGHSLRARAVEAGINDQRAQHGCEPLRLHSGLALAAGRQARLLLADGRLDHNAGTPFAERLAQAAPDAHLWGENLAWGSGDLAQPSAIVESWMRSPEHRQIMLDCRFSQVGIGVATGQFGELGDGSVYTADFAT